MILHDSAGLSCPWPCDIDEHVLYVCCSGPELKVTCLNDKGSSSASYCEASRGRMTRHQIDLSRDILRGKGIFELIASRLKGCGRARPCDILAGCHSTYERTIGSITGGGGGALCRLQLPVIRRLHWTWRQRLRASQSLSALMGITPLIYHHQFYSLS